MDFYCLSIFVDPNRMDPLEKLFATLDFPVSSMHGVENGLPFRAFEVAINHVGLIFVESNAFHKHLDFEIGLVEAGRKDFLGAKSKLDTMGVATKWVEDGDTAFVLNDDSHGPFFFKNVEGYPKEENLKSLMGTIAPSDFLKYQLVRDHFFSESLKQAIQLESSDSEVFQVKSIEVLGKNERISAYSCEGLLRLSIKAEITAIVFE